MREDPQEREERPWPAAQLHTVDLERPKDTPEGSDLEAAVAGFAAFSQPGDVAAAFLPDGSIVLLERTPDGVYTEPGDEDSATLLLVNGRAA